MGDDPKKDEPKPEWIAELHGHEFDLRRLARMQSAGWSIRDEGGWYGLHAKEFEALGDPRSIHNRATELLGHIVNVARLEWPDLEPVRVNAIRRVGDVAALGVYVTDTLVAASRASTELGAVLIKDAAGNIIEQPHGAQDCSPGAWVEVSRQDHAVAKALRLLTEGTWANLYKALEVVEGDVGGRIVRDGWIAKTAMDRFTQTANSADALGDEARHGIRRTPSPPVPMALDEARALIRQVVRRWIEWKAQARGHRDHTPGPAPHLRSLRSAVRHPHPRGRRGGRAGPALSRVPPFAGASEGAGRSGIVGELDDR